MKKPCSKLDQVKYCRKNCVINWGADGTSDPVAFGFTFLHCFFEGVYSVEQYCHINIKKYVLRFKKVIFFSLERKIIAYANFQALLKNCNCYYYSMVNNGKYEF